MEKKYLIWRNEPSWKVLETTSDGKPLMLKSDNGDVLRYTYEDGKLVSFEGTRHPKEKD